ncbi:MAG: preprotein translocase subunit SecG [Candidatus Daviesbacteria bacterium]|nr:preprotein translocase subunit SecG [Candidatus Daviesbacteria bacterium]
MDKNFLSIFQIIISLGLICLILIQAKGSGLGSTFGGESGFYRTKRGFEKLLFYTTIVFAFLFLFSSILGILL